MKTNFIFTPDEKQNESNLHQNKKAMKSKTLLEILTNYQGKNESTILIFGKDGKPYADINEALKAGETQPTIKYALDSLIDELNGAGYNLAKEDLKVLHGLLNGWFGKSEVRNVAVSKGGKKRAGKSDEMTPQQEKELEDIIRIFQERKEKGVKPSSEDKSKVVDYCNRYDNVNKKKLSEQLGENYQNIINWNKK